jgi:hypothetical protein
VRQVGVQEGPVNLKGSVKSDEAFSLTGVWITYGTSANVRTGSAVGLAYTLPRLVQQKLYFMSHQPAADSSNLDLGYDMV